MSKKLNRHSALQCMRCTKPITDDMEFIFVQCRHCNHYWHTQCEQHLSCCSANYCSILVHTTIDDESEIYMPNAFSAMTRFTRNLFTHAIIISPGQDIILVQSLYNRAQAWIRETPAWGVTDSSGCHYNTDQYYLARMHLPYDYVIDPVCKAYLASMSRVIFHYMIISMYPVNRFLTGDTVDIMGAHPIVSREIILRHLDSNQITHKNHCILQIMPIKMK